jgi:hypothetical protein
LFSKVKFRLRMMLEQNMEYVLIYYVKASSDRKADVCE